LIDTGKELGEADDIVFGHTNSKQKNGAVGILTGNVIVRTSYYTEAVILASIPFKNAEIY
jgi:non-canonical (house-cleaning) NTP pyrophosphatase